MKLTDRITLLAQAIGIDIKAIMLRLAALERGNQTATVVTLAPGQSANIDSVNLTDVVGVKWMLIASTAGGDTYQCEIAANAGMGNPLYTKYGVLGSAPVAIGVVVESGALALHAANTGAQEIDISVLRLPIAR